MTDQNYEKIIKFRMEKAKKALEKNNMQVFIADNKNEVLNIVKTLIKKGDIIGSGGSVSLTQCGIIDLLRTPDYNFLDRANFTPENIKEFYIKWFQYRCLFHQRQCNHRKRRAL